MYKNKKILAVIPARGGSKGIPSKNIIEVGGKPLIQYTIDCAKHSRYIDRAVISTDSEEIKKVSIECGGDVPFMRPKELALDTSKTIDCIVHAVNTLKEMGETYDYVMIIQNTVPLRKSWHVDESIEKLIDSKERSLVSVTEVEQHPILMRTINEDGTVKNLLPMSSTMRRQDFPKFYKVDGAIAIQKIDEEFNLNTSINDGRLAYIMDSKYSTDIDSYIDIKVIEYYLEKEKEEEIKEARF
jgi:CMP-N,N'-diacetyllegionaminic acid synthase